MYIINIVLPPSLLKGDVKSCVRFNVRGKGVNGRMNLVFERDFYIK